jgi:hypothetical protein
VFHFDPGPADKILVKRLIWMSLLIFSAQGSAQLGNVVTSAEDLSGPPKASGATDPAAAGTQPVLPGSNGSNPQLNLPALPSSALLDQLAKQKQEQQNMPLLNPPQTSPPGGGGSPPPFSNPFERMAGSEGQYGSGGGHSHGGGSSYSSGTPNASADSLPGIKTFGKPNIVDPFKQQFPKCTEAAGLGQCKFVFLGIWGDPAHRARKSCHNTGEAIDVGLPFQCTNGGKIDAQSPKALEVARCMANNAGGQFGVIFQDRREGPNFFPGHPPGAHNGHMHIQLRSCR